MDRSAVVSPLTYTPAPGWKEVSSPASSAGDFVRATGIGTVAPGSASHDDILRAQEKEIREQGYQEGLARARADFESAVSAQRELVAAALRDFSGERDSYFHQVEGEVVALALAIVRKILRRESQVDPLLLSGLVRVALEKSSSSQTAKLRVHPSEVARWESFFASHTDLPLKPEVVADAALAEMECSLETEFGTTNVDVESQVKEIEKGLFDLLAQRPAPR